MQLAAQTWKTMKLLVGVLVVCVLILAADGVADIGCVDSRDCGPGNCCIITRARHSKPRCAAFLAAGRVCRGGANDPVNMTVYYEDGQVDLTNVYYDVCQCSDGLVCKRETSKCETV